MVAGGKQPEAIGHIMQAGEFVLFIINMRSLWRKAVARATAGLFAEQAALIWGGLGALGEGGRGVGVLLCTVAPTSPSVKRKSDFCQL